MNSMDMKKTALLPVFLAFFHPILWANPSMSDDYKHMMEWLTHETAQGLAFSVGSTFDPPNELKAWRMQPDISLGVGWVPLDKSKFPNIATPSLADLNPANVLPNQVTFANLAFHLRMGLPGRYDVSFRGADMTVPKGYKLSGSTTGEGQSNSLGFTLRRHFLGGDRPLVSLSANYNHVFGRFYFSNQYKNLELTPGFLVDARNQGMLQWNVSSIGGNAVMSRTFGIWTPFAGIGYNRMFGSVRGRLESSFDADLILPPHGEASDNPEENQGRFIFGVQMDRTHFGFFFNAEMKAVGYAAGKTYAVSAGIAAPFRFGATSVVKRGPRERRPLAYDRVEEIALDARRAAISDVRTEQTRKGRSREDALPEMIFIR